MFGKGLPPACPPCNTVEVIAVDAAEAPEAPLMDQASLTRIHLVDFFADDFG
jgi:hypothetical protein